MRKQYRIIKNHDGYIVELNTMYVSDKHRYRTDTDDSWFSISHTCVTLAEAKECLERYKRALNFQVVHEE